MSVDKPTLVIPGISCRELIAQSGRKSAKKILDSLVDTIDKLVATAHTAGKNSIVYDLPVIFDIKNLNKQDSSTLIYSELLSVYKSAYPMGKEFPEVYIQITKEKAILTLEWYNGMSEEERKRRKEFINSCIK